MSLAMAYHMKKRNKSHEMSRGGDVKGVHPESHYSKKGGTSHAGAATRQENHYKEMRQEGDHSDIAGEHKRVLGEMHEMKGHDRKYLAEGGEIDGSMPCENCGHISGSKKEDYDDEDMVGQIMKKRHGYSKGGEVANEDEPMADSEPAEFDDLVKDDGLEFHETGKNSGDEDGDEQEDEDRHDIVSQIMKSRKKKDKMPHPA